jgi:hypothetical protein
MIATVIFTDPGDDGNITIANGYEAYPGKSDQLPISSFSGVRFGLHALAPMPSLTQEQEEQRSTQISAMNLRVFI